MDRLVRQIAVYEACFEHLHRIGCHISNSVYSVRHAEEKEALKTVLKQRAERNVLFDHGDEQRDFVDRKIEELKKNAVWSEVLADDEG